MKNFVQPGKVITIRNVDRVVESGEMVVFGDLAGVAISGIDEGQNLAIQTEGVFFIDKNVSDTVEVGTRLSYNESTKKLSKNLSTGKIVAVAVDDASNGQTHVMVKLLPTVLPSDDTPVSA